MLSENRMRWQFQPGHYEAWYATLSQLATRTGFWIRYTLSSPEETHGNPSGRVWFARFDPEDSARSFGVNRRFDIIDLESHEDPFSLRIGDCELSDGQMRGRLDSAERKIEWDLSWSPSPTVHRHLPSVAYVGSWADTRVLSPNLNVAVSGKIIVDDEQYLFDGDPLGQSHLWGRKHAYRWAWAHLNTFSDRKTVLEALTVQIRRGPIVVPHLSMMTLHLDGEIIELREPWQLPFVRAQENVGELVMRATTPRYRIDLSITAPRESLLMAEYVDPDGDSAYCHHTECGHATLRIARREGLRYVPYRTLETEAAHVEWGMRGGDSKVHLRHEAID